MSKTGGQAGAREREATAGAQRDWYSLDGSLGFEEVTHSLAVVGASNWYLTQRWRSEM